MAKNESNTDTANTVSPDFSVYTQTSDKTPLVRVGAAWNHKKGDGLSIRLDAVPVNGTLVLFPPWQDKAT